MRLPFIQFDVHENAVYGLGGVCLGIGMVAVYSAAISLQATGNSTSESGSEQKAQSAAGLNLNDSKRVVFSRPIIDSGVEQVYAFDERANKLLRIMFPPAVRPAAANKALVSVPASQPMSNLDHVLNWTLDGNFVAEDGPDGIRVGSDQVDSYWLSIHRLSTPRRADALLDLANNENMGELIRGLRDSGLPFVSLIEQAIFQRDVYQIFSIFHNATRISDSAELRSVGQSLLVDLAGLFQRLRFSESDYGALLRLRPKDVCRKYFTDVNNFRLEEDYLPVQVLRNDETWYRLDRGVNSTRHFRQYSGRSFVRTYIRPRNMSREEFAKYWSGLRQSYGEDLMVSSEATALPAGTETLLVRSFGVFLDDGSYADTGFPEEVLMRNFQYEKHQFDPATSDLRGSLHYQYKLKRKRLIADPASLGLQRIRDDDPQFLGFFGEVPDPFNATSEAIGTMRFNCIGCHSETLYGVSTVFSLSVEEPASVSDEAESASEILVTTSRRGFFRLKSPEFEELCRLLKS